MIVLVRLLRDAKRTFLWWAVGMVALNLMTAAFFPTIKGDASFDAIIADLPAPMRSLAGMPEGLSISTAPGYLNARLFSLLLPLLLVGFATAAGARAISGSEADGTLELLLANPVSRTRVFLERLAGTGLLILGLVVVSGASLLAIGPPFGLLEGVSAGHVVEAYVAAGCLAAFFGAGSLAIGACTGRRSAALGVSGALAVGSYLLHALLANSTSLSWLRSTSPWAWYAADPVVLRGAGPVAYIPALAFLSVFSLGGWWGFRRRDLH